MDTIYFIDNLPSMTVKVEVVKGSSSVHEDFSRAEVWMFLSGSEGRKKISCTAENGVVTGTFTQSSASLQAGTYDIELIWKKNGERERLAGGSGTAAIQRAKVENAFAAASYSSADSTGLSDSVTLTFKTSVATYGYDGLDAYERAVMLGQTTLTEAEWIYNADEVSQKVEELQSVADSIPTFSYDASTNTLTITTK